MKNNYRNITQNEIKQLKKQRCSCDNWEQVTVSDNFNPDRVNDCQFSGKISIGSFSGNVSFFGGVEKKRGLYNTHFHNCSIADNVYINNIKNYIANYDIHKNVVINSVNLIAVEQESSFGNGVEVAVLQEDGSRSVPIFDKLSAHHAYLMAFYRHRPRVIEALRNIAQKYTASVTSSIGTIESDVRITDCGTIKNVRIGKSTTIEETYSLENGTINSCDEAPVFIGASVIMKNFIIASGSRITEGVLISNCFIGQSCELSKQYSADSSLLFANCIGSHSEAWSIFAGPYTVTHHKATLLISGLYSFLNAGSGSNQSNHMYKLGPVHQGIVERGSKTTSDSYLLWPAKVGAFTLVMGRHYHNSDTSNLPFSYLIENNDESVLVPGINLKSVGTIRDSKKWPARDKRKDPHILDHINFDLLSPYTIQKMLNGIDILNHIQEISGETSDHYTFNSVKIKNSSLHSGIKYYNLAIDKFLGNTVIKHLENIEFKNNDHLQKSLTPNGVLGKGEWLDICGLLTSHDIAEKLLLHIEEGRINTIDTLNENLQSIHSNYRNFQWVWVIDILEKRFSKTVNQFLPSDIIELIKQWKKSVINLDKMLIADAKKEFSANAKIGFGLDGDPERKKKDFEHVRGTFEENEFVKDVKRHIIEKSDLGSELISRLKKIV